MAGTWDRPPMGSAGRPQLDQGTGALGAVVFLNAPGKISAKITIFRAFLSARRTSKAPEPSGVTLRASFRSC